MNALNAAPANEISELAARIRTGTPIAIGSITLVPLTSEGDGLQADLLEEGIARAHTTVTEIGVQGSVNLLSVHHQGPQVLLLLDGEEVVGAKQNRGFNASFLVPPGATVQIPVSCVEHGRWHYRSAMFGSSGRTLTSCARSSKLCRTSNSVTTSGHYDADQQAVWSDVACYLERTETRSPTAAFADAAERRLSIVECRIPESLPGQTGVAVVQGDKLVSIDILGSADLFRRSWKKIARGILAEVYDKSPPATDAVATVRVAVSQPASIPVVRKTPPGCGGDPARQARPSRGRDRARREGVSCWPGPPSDASPDSCRLRALWATGEQGGAYMS